MQREQFYHAIRTACTIINRSEVTILGSQSILASFSEDELPKRATLSREIDILPIDDNPETVKELADLIEGVAGELSPFEQLHGFAIDGVDDSTAILSSGWRDRLIAVSGPATSLPGSTLSNTGYCLSPEDLCVAKLCANRDKDREFVGALLDAAIVNPYDVMNLLELLDEQHEEAKARAQSFLHHWKDSKTSRSRPTAGCG